MLIRSMITVAQCNFSPLTLYCCAFLLLIKFAGHWTCILLLLSLDSLHFIHSSYPNIITTNDIYFSLTFWWFAIVRWLMEHSGCHINTHSDTFNLQTKRDQNTQYSWIHMIERYNHFHLHFISIICFFSCTCHCFPTEVSQQCCHLESSY